MLRTISNSLTSTHHQNNAQLHITALTAGWRPSSSVTSRKAGKRRKAQALLESQLWQHLFASGH
jgi:hypothetical protein